MRKLPIVLALVAILCSAAFTQELTFRGFPFSATPDEVIDELGPPDAQTTSDEAELIGAYMLRYDDSRVAGYTAEMEIEFGSSGALGDPTQPASSGIAAGTYLFMFKQPELIGGVMDPTAYVNAYLDLAAKLEQVYGPPELPPNVEPIEQRISSLFARQYAAAAPYLTEWEVGDAAIQLRLMYSSKWDLVLSYLSPTVVEAFARAQRRAEESTEGL